MIETLTAEIESLHDFFVEWFSGAVADDPQVFHERFEVRFGADSVLIQPGGQVATAADFIAAVRAGYGGSPDFRIAIRNVAQRAEFDEGTFLVTYEEWQRNAVNSTPQDNARLASVVLQRRATGYPWCWLHIHETWLPSQSTPAARFDF